MAAVRELSFRVCAAAFVVTPLSTYTVHCVYSSRYAVPAANVRVAVDLAELVTEAVNVVVPQPLVVGSERLPMANVGSFRTTVSVGSSCSLMAKENDRDVGPRKTVLFSWRLEL
jgi:hypothetical protein